MENITHLFENEINNEIEKITFKKRGIAFDISLMPINQRKQIFEELKANPEYKEYCLSSYLFGIDNYASINPEIKKYLDDNPSQYFDVYRHDNKSYINRNCIIIELIDLTEYELENKIIKGLGKIINRLENYFLIEVYNNNLEEIYKILEYYKEAEVLNFEANWQTISKYTRQNILSHSSYSEKESLPENNAYKNIQFTIKESEVITEPIVNICLMDNGVSGNHEDLIDSFIKEKSKTFLPNDNSYLPDKKDYHGTKCAGIITGNSHEKTGIIGTGIGCNLISYRIASGDNESSPLFLSNFVLMKAFLSALKDDIHVINCSWVLNYRSHILNRIINKVVNEGRDGKGLPIVFAAGNLGEKIKFPCTNKNVITVSATSLSNKPYKGIYEGESWETNYGDGDDKILIAAPGVELLTTDIPGGEGGHRIEHPTNPKYTYYNHTKFWGTSASAPIISGLIGQILKIKPEIELKQIKNLLKNSTIQFNSNSNIPPNRNYGSGIINYELLKYNLNKL